MAERDFYPVPNPPPDEGEQHICSIADAWIPVLIGQMEKLRDPLQWKDPPDDITAQVNEFIAQIVKDYEVMASFSTNYTHLHLNSRVVAGAGLVAVISAAQELGTYWRQFPAAQNDQTYFELWLDIGSYSFDVCHINSAGAGKLTIQIEGEPFPGWVVDFYASPSQSNIHDVLPFDVTIAGLKRVKMTAAERNPLSSGYVLNITYISIKKTG